MCEANLPTPNAIAFIWSYFRAELLARTLDRGVNVGQPVAQFLQTRFHKQNTTAKSIVGSTMQVRHHFSCLGTVVLNNNTRAYHITTSTMTATTDAATHATATPHPPYPLPRLLLLLVLPLLYSPSPPLLPQHYRLLVLIHIRLPSRSLPLLPLVFIPSAWWSFTIAGRKRFAECTMHYLRATLPALLG